jgi:hypothetical protein
MTRQRSCECGRFDPLVILAGALTALAYTVCLAFRRVAVETVPFNVLAGEFLASPSGVLHLWGLSRRAKHHRDSSRLAVFHPVLGSPLCCCGRGAIGH